MLAGSDAYQCLSRIVRGVCSRHLALVLYAEAPYSRRTHGSIGSNIVQGFLRYRMGWHKHASLSVLNFVLLWRPPPHNVTHDDEAPLAIRAK